MQQSRKTQRCIATIGVDGEIREHIGGCDTDQSAGRVHLLFRQAHVRALQDELGRQTQRQILRQLQGVQGEALVRFLVRVAAEQCGQQIALHGQLLLQRRQRCLYLGKRSLLCGHFAAIGEARFQLLAQNAEHLGVDGDDLPGRLDLAA